MDKNTPLVAVAMSVYDGVLNTEHLELAIDSVLKQTFTEFSFFIVDDGIQRSDLKNILERNQNKDTRIKIIKQDTNKGLAHALNKIISEMESNILIRMDADDINHPERFKKLIAFLDENQTVDIVGSYIQEFSTNIEAKGPLIKYPIEHQEMKSFFLNRNPLAHPSVAIRSSFFQKSGNYPTFSITNEDTLLWLSGFLNGAKFANIPQALYYLRFDENASQRRTGFRKSLSDFIDRIRIIIDLKGSFIHVLKAFLLFIISLTPFYSWLRKKII